MVSIKQLRKAYLFRKGKSASESDELDSGSCDVTDLEVVNQPPVFDESQSESIVMNHRAGNCARRKQFEINDSERIDRVYRTLRTNPESVVPAVRSPVSDVLGIMAEYDRPEFTDESCGCRTSSYAMTPAKWKSRYLTADSNRTRTARSSIVRIDPARCRSAFGHVSGHWGKVKATYCRNAWE